MMMKVSVIVPVLDREKLIKRSLDSILNQSVKPFEIIVVDNGSSDHTYHTVERWIYSNRHAGIHLKLFTEDKKGACFARQKGLQESEGNYLIFFDSDDEMHPDLIKKATLQFQNDENIDLVCWKCRIKKLDGNYRVPPFNVVKPLENHLIHSLLRTQGYMISKEFLVTAGGWSKNIPVWNDLELGLRILLNNPRIKGLPEILAFIYSQNDSISGIDFSSKEGQWENTLQEMENMASNSYYSSKKKILRILNYRRVILAAHYFKEGNKKAALKLMTTTLSDKNYFEKLLLRFSYLYTRHGLRGAWSFIHFFY